MPPEASPRSVVRMHVEGAEGLVAELRLAASDIDQHRLDLLTPHADALALIAPGVPAAASGPVALLSRVADTADAMADDLQWRIGRLSAADLAIDDVGRLVGALAPRNLALVTLDDDRLAGLLLAAVDSPGDPTAVADLLHEAAIRATTDPDSAARLLARLGAPGLAGLWRLVNIDDEPDTLPGQALTAIVVLGSGAPSPGVGTDVIALVEQASLLHTFGDEDRHLFTLIENFASVDTASGGEPDGLASTADLVATAAGTGPLAETAQWLLDHPSVLSGVDRGSAAADWAATGGDLGSQAGDHRFDLTDVDDYRTKRNAAFLLAPVTTLVDIAGQQPEDADGVRSRADWETALGWDGLTAGQRDAVQLVIDTEAWDDTGTNWVGTFVDVAGFVPILGDAIDGATALWLLANGDLEGAALAGIGLLPVPGVSGGAVRAAKETIEELGQVAARSGTRAAAERVGRETAAGYVGDRVGTAVAEEVTEHTDNPYLGDAAGWVAGTATTGTLGPGAVEAPEPPPPPPTP